MPTPYNDVALLLRRAGFGGRPDEISQLAQYDLPVVVERVLDTSANPPVVEPAVAADPAEDDYDRWVSMVQWWTDRMASSPTPIVEKMTLFWHMHFTSSFDKCQPQAMWDQNQIFRSLGLGSFKALTQAVAVSAAMLDYLDNRTNVKSGPNENFARELMELFTMGVNQYTQADVVAAARAWTGHATSGDRLTYVFNSDRHDYGNKTFMGTTKNWDGPDIVGNICTGSGMPRTARFIAAKLWAFFAYADPSITLLDELTAAFIGHNLNIKSQLRTMFLRPEFYSTESRDGHVRTPVEFLVASQRYTGLDSSIAHPEWHMEPIGQRLFFPPNVGGWRTGPAWVSTSAMWAKGNYARFLTWKAIDAGVLAGTGAVSVQTAVQRAFDTFGIDRPSAATRAALESTVTAERTARGWAEQANLITLIMLSPEFQMG